MTETRDMAVDDLVTLVGLLREESKILKQKLRSLSDAVQVCSSHKHCSALCQSTCRVPHRL